MQATGLLALPRLALWGRASTSERLGVSYSMAARAGTKTITQVIATIADEDWGRIVYREGRRGLPRRHDLHKKTPRQPARPDLEHALAEARAGRFGLSWPTGSTGPHARCAASPRSSKT